MCNSNVNDYFSAENTLKRIEDMRSTGEKIHDEPALKSKKGDSPYLDTQLFNKKEKKYE